MNSSYASYKNMITESNKKNSALGITKIISAQKINISATSSATSSATPSATPFTPSATSSATSTTMVVRTPEKTVMQWKSGLIKKDAIQPVIKQQKIDKALLMLSDDDIARRISTPYTNNKYDIYIINLKDRTDRKQYIIDTLGSNQTFFNIKFFEAIKHIKGYVGCGLSHYSLIKYAKTNNLPYIIVMEDDTKILDYTETYDILNWLVNNLDLWDVFNGNPTMFEFYNKPNALLKYKSKNDKLCYLSWGQTANFIIYNASSYDRLLTYNFDNHIDLYIPKICLQLCPLKFISMQNPFHSDITHSTMNDTINNNIYIRAQTIIHNAKMIDDMPIIGVFSIFIDTYIYFYEDFIKNMELYFLPHYKKYYYIVTDKHDIKIFNNRTFIFYTEKIGWPYETLYRYKYYLQFKESDRKKSTYTYFLNSNAVCARIIDEDAIPDSSGYAFTTHITFKSIYGNCIFEKDNKKSTAYIPHEKNRTYTYYGGGFFGATTEKFTELCNFLDENIKIDEQNKYIARMHDESHLNYFCNMVMNHKFKQLSIDYHVPEYHKSLYPNVKIVYLDKKRYIKDMSKNTKKTITCGEIIINKYNEKYINISSSY